MTNVIYYDGDRVTISKQSKRNLPHIVTVRDINGKHKKQFSFKTASEARKKYLDIENAKIVPVADTVVDLNWTLVDIGNYFLADYDNFQEGDNGEEYISEKDLNRYWLALWRFHEAYCLDECPASRVVNGPTQQRKDTILVKCTNPHMTLGSIRTFSAKKLSNYLHAATSFITNKPLAFSGIDHSRMEINQIFNALPDNIITKKHFNFKVMKKAKQKVSYREAFEPQEITKLFGAMSEYESPYRYLWYIAFNTGLRPNELLGLRQDDLAVDDNGNMMLRVKRRLHKQSKADGNKYIIRAGSKTFKSRKGDAGVREIPANKELIDVWNKHIALNNSFKNDKKYKSYYRKARVHLAKNHSQSSVDIAKNLMFTRMPVVSHQTSKDMNECGFLDFRLGYPLTADILRHDIRHYASLVNITKKMLGSYTARHTCITNWAKYLYGKQIGNKIIGITDLMVLSGHAELQTFKRYIDETQFAPAAMVDLMKEHSLK